jgi:hypothetical protein
MAYGQQARDSRSQTVPNVFEPSGSTQKLTSSGTSVASTAYTKDTIIRIVSDADCHYKIGTTPTAANTDVYLPSKSGEQILVKSGNKVAVIAASVNVYLTELN